MVVGKLGQLVAGHLQLAQESQTAEILRQLWYAVVRQIEYFEVRQLVQSRREDFDEVVRRQDRFDGHEVVEVVDRLKFVVRHVQFQQGS